MSASQVAHAGEHELTAVERDVWKGLLRTHAALVKALDAELEAAHGLPLTSYEVLLHVARAPGGRLRMAELADSVLLSRSGTTRLVDRLESEGYVRRDTCDEDKRGSWACLTEAGSELLARARPSHLEAVRARFLRHFSEDELAAMASFWKRVDLSLQD